LPTESIPSCILLDVRISGLDGPGLQKRLAELGSTLPIIFLTGYPDIAATIQAIKAGADDVLTKPITTDDLLRAIEKAFAHQRTLRDLNDKLDSVRARFGRLTPREREVLELVIRGEPNKQIARAYHTYRDGPSPQRDGEDAGQIVGGACVHCREDRHCVGSDKRTRPLFVVWNHKALILRQVSRTCSFKSLRRVGGQDVISKRSQHRFVVDDDPGMLKCVQRLLRLHAYEPVLVSFAKAFKNYTDVEKAACVIFDTT
jgi:FixJ family two-component response regulator